jgi:lipid-A-disaccharide synthase-like uncharacterized protein
MHAMCLQFLYNILTKYDRCFNLLKWIHKLLKLILFTKQFIIQWLMIDEINTFKCTEFYTVIFAVMPLFEMIIYNLGFMQLPI